MLMVKFSMKSKPMSPKMAGNNMFLLVHVCLFASRGGVSFPSPETWPGLWCAFTNGKQQKWLCQLQGSPSEAQWLLLCSLGCRQPCCREVLVHPLSEDRPSGEGGAPISFLLNAVSQVSPLGSHLELRASCLLEPCPNCRTVKRSRCCGGLWWFLTCQENAETWWRQQKKRLRQWGVWRYGLWRYQRREFL